MVFSSLVLFLAKSDRRVCRDFAVAHTFLVFVQSSARSDSLFASPLATSFDDMVTALQSFQELVGMVQCDGMWLESEGRLLDAAENYLAILRSSDLLGRHGFVTQKLHGMWNYRVAAARLIRWSEDSRLGAEELRLETSIRQAKKQIRSHLGKPMWKARQGVRGLFGSGFQIRFHLVEPRWKADHYGVNGVVCGCESISSSGRATFVEVLEKTTGITSFDTAAS